jgi:transposase
MGASDSEARRRLLALVDDLQRREEGARQMRRLDCLLLVSGGMSSEAVAHALGLSPRAVQRWVRSYGDGEGSVLAKRKGRPRVLGDDQLALVSAWFKEVGAMGASGAALQAEVERQFGVCLSLRQCQRLLSQLAP